MYPWYVYPTVVPFGNPNYDAALGGAHDTDVAPPPNCPVTVLLAGIVTDISSPTWGKQVGLQLDTPYNNIPYMAYLHLASVDPSLVIGDHVVQGELLGWAGGANNSAQYLGTVNPTGINFLNTPQMSSQIQVGVALMRGTAYGGIGWEQFPPVDWALDPTQIIKDARSTYWKTQSPAPLFVDVSSFQPADVDWVAYKNWASQWDGTAHVSLRVNQGTGSQYLDGNYAGYCKGARDAGVDALIHYHYAYPQFNKPLDEADYFVQVLNTPGPQDILMLDYEENSGAMGAANMADWAYQWLVRVSAAYPNNVVTLYASHSFATNLLQDSRLAVFPLTLADWQYDPQVRPQCPSPWINYRFLQFSDSMPHVPGFGSALVDVNIYVKGEGHMLIPTGWVRKTVDGDDRLYNPANNFYVRGSFKDFVLSYPGGWESWNIPVGPEGHMDILEGSNPDLGGGTSQLFKNRRLEMVTNQGNKIIEGWIGQELDWVISELALLEAQLASSGIPPAVQALINDMAASMQSLASAANSFTTQLNTVGVELQQYVK